MRKMGAYCRSLADGWFEASLVVVDGDRLVDQRTITCADPADQAPALEQLRRATMELLAATAPDELVVWELVPVPFGIPGGIRGAAAGIRAEGVVLGAAAAAGVPVRVSDRHAVLDASVEARVGAAVVERVARLRPEPDSTASRHAAAIAVV
jgi:hypothetical protein